MAESVILDAINAAATFLIGYSQLRKPHESAVHEAVFVTLPTGSGKSLCYYLLPKGFDEQQISP